VPKKRFNAAAFEAKVNEGNAMFQPDLIRLPFLVSSGSERVAGRMLSPDSAEEITCAAVQPCVVLETVGGAIHSRRLS
jgi:hypothetical protein